MSTPTLIPQANEPWKLAGTVVAVSAGCHTAVEIADALDVDPRQGNYYATAAEAVGLLDRTGDVPAQWVVTTLGNDLATTADGGSAQAVAARLAGALAADPRVASLLDTDPDEHDTVLDAIEADFCLDGLGADTAQRRRSTIAAWARFVRTQGHDQSDAVAASAAAARRAAPAIVAAREARLAAERAAAEAAAPDFCDSCHQQLPATGICDWC